MAHNFNPIAGNESFILDGLRKEYAAYHFYRNAATWLAVNGYQYAAKYFDAEAAHELEHAKMHENYLREWNINFKIPIEVSDESFESLKDCINQAEEIEIELYKQYDYAAKQAMGLDTSMYQHLSQFVGIQRQSIAEWSAICDRMNVIGISDTAALIEFEEQVFSEQV